MSSLTVVRLYFVLLFILAAARSASVRNQKGSGSQFKGNANGRRKSSSSAKSYRRSGQNNGYGGFNNNKRQSWPSKSYYYQYRYKNQSPYQNRPYKGYQGLKYYQTLYPDGYNSYHSGDDYFYSTGSYLDDTTVTTNLAVNTETSSKTTATVGKTTDSSTSTVENVTDTSIGGWPVDISTNVMIVSGAVGFIILAFTSTCYARSRCRKRNRDSRMNSDKTIGIEYGKEIVFSIGNKLKESQRVNPYVKADFKSRSLPAPPSIPQVRHVPLLPGQIKMIQDNDELYATVDEFKIEETLE